MEIRTIATGRSVMALNERLRIMREALETVRDTAACSEGVEFYHMVADNALKECEFD
jgi:hypothetical protein